MAARILELAAHAGRRRSTPAVAQAAHGIADPRPLPRFRFWRGASGLFYVHTIHTLLACPELGPAVYMLVRRTPSGRRVVLHVGRVEADAPSLNLAEVRWLGATLGANEVQVHLIAAKPGERRLIELDLRAGLLGTLGRGRARSAGC
jgi:hypothetical protein